jgi:hypothetical protein
MFRRGGFRLHAANWDLWVLWPDSFRKRQSVTRYALVTSLPLCFPVTICAVTRIAIVHLMLWTDICSNNRPGSAAAVRAEARAGRRQEAPVRPFL